MALFVPGLETSHEEGERVAEVLSDRLDERVLHIGSAAIHSRKVVGAISEAREAGNGNTVITDGTGLLAVRNALLVPARLLSFAPPLATPRSAELLAKGMAISGLDEDSMAVEALSRGDRSRDDIGILSTKVRDGQGRVMLPDDNDGLQVAIGAADYGIRTDVVFMRGDDYDMIPPADKVLEAREQGVTVTFLDGGTREFIEHPAETFAAYQNAVNGLT